MNGDYNSSQALNFMLGATGAVLNQSSAFLENEKRALQAAKYTKDVARNISSIDRSLTKLSNTGKVLGAAGVLISGAALGYNYAYGDGITAGQAFDFAVGVGLTALTISNPVLLVGFGVYGLLDAAGTFDGIKDSLGGDTVILQRSH